jgi:glycosyltransferase involved in cell wall biosynthesis
MIMTLYRKIDRTKIQFDFVVNTNNKEYDYEAEIRKLGGREIYVPRYTVFNYREYKREWINLLSNHPEWTIIHGHHTSPARIYLTLAKAVGRKTIAHSHTAGGDKSIKSRIKYYLRGSLKSRVDYLFACSKEASYWMFGKMTPYVKIINNAIDTEKYRFNKDTRFVKRAEFALQNKFVVGHIGNFSKAKNYPFILDIFNEISFQNDDAVLMLVGNNKKNPNIKEEVLERGLEDKVIFTGVQSNIPDLLQLMDVFLFPSLYEGLPVTIIEAQAAGLQCIVSDTITNEVKITDFVKFISLGKPASYWADQVLKFAKGYERKDTCQAISEASYDVKETAKWLQNFYIMQHNNSSEK